MRRFGQGGFATLEVILMVTVLGILASIAVPRFNDITTRANTAKVQADLTAIDTAIAVYNLRTGDYPENVEALVTANDLEEEVSPPRGKVYVTESNGSIVTVEDNDEYELNADKTRAVLKSKTAGVFYYDSSKTYTSSSSSGGD